MTICRFGNLLALACLVWSAAVLAQEDIHSTTSVTMLQKAQPAVALVYPFNQEGRPSGQGSASVIDPRGYMLTAKHVVKDRHLVLLGGRPPLAASLVGVSPEFDVALLRLGKPAYQRAGSPKHARAEMPLDFVILGVDNELRMGETIFNVGSPGGRGIVASRGIVSAVAFTGVNPLSIALQSSTAFDELIQFDAASNPGNSGGPLLNMHGQQVGMAVSGIPGEEGIHFALPTKVIRHSVFEILCSELRRRYVSGIHIDRQLANVIVTEVEAESPASQVGLKAGDQIVTIDGRPLRDPIDWAFSKFAWKPKQTIAMTIKRGSETLSVDLQLADRHARQGVSCKAPQPGLQCRFASYDPNIGSPIDDADRPTGPPITIPVVSPRPDGVEPEDHYQLLIEGFLKITTPGRYRLGLRSDDGSRLWLHDKLLVDNNGNHAAILRTSWADLDAGLHPIRIDFYEDQGNQELEFQWAKDDGPLEPVPQESLVHASAD